MPSAMATVRRDQRVRVGGFHEEFAAALAGASSSSVSADPASCRSWSTSDWSHIPFRNIASMVDRREESQQEGAIMWARFLGLGLVGITSSTLLLQACGDSNDNKSPSPTPSSTPAIVCALMDVRGTCSCGVTALGSCVGDCGGGGQCSHIGTAPGLCGCAITEPSRSPTPAAIPS